jgi:hypothetical protein
LFICSMLLRILFYFLLWSRKRGHRKDQWICFGKMGRLQERRDLENRQV